MFLRSVRASPGPQLSKASTPSERCARRGCRARAGHRGHSEGTTAADGLLCAQDRAQAVLPGHAVGKAAVFGAAGFMAQSMPAAAHAQEAAADAATSSSAAPVEVVLQGNADAAVGASDTAAATAEDAAALLGSATSSALETTSAAQEATTAAASAVLSAASEVQEETVEAITAAASAVSAVAADATTAVSDTVSAVSSVASDATAAVTDTVSAIASDATSAVGDTVSAVSAIASDATSAVGETVSGALDAASGSLSRVASTVEETTSFITAGATNTVSAVTGAAQGAVTSVTGALSGLQNSVVAASEAAAGSAFSALPPQVQDVVLAVPPAAAAAAHFVGTYPLQLSAGAVAIAVPLTLNYWKARYAGYAGEIDPPVAYDALLNDDAVLVDIRSEAERRNSGLPELKYSARFKATVWEPLELEPSTLKRASDAKALALEVNAAYLAGTKLAATPLTKFIIMDASGSDAARDFARALRSVGVSSPYVVSGGFQAWEESGLGVVAGGPLVYEGNVVEYLQDELELLGQQVADAAKPLRDPVVATSVGAGVVAGVVAVYNYKTTLQWIGVVGLMASAANFALRYDSPDAMLKDVQQTWGKLTGGLSRPSPPPPKIQANIQPVLPTPVAGAAQAASSVAEKQLVVTPVVESSKAGLDDSDESAGKVADTA